MSTNGILDFQGTNKATFVGENSNVVIDTVNASFGIGVDVNGPTSNLHVVGNAYVSTELTVGGSLSAAKDQDVTSYFGRAAIGYNGTNSDAATFAHVDHNTPESCALRHSTGGATRLNAKGNQSILFTVGNVEKARIKNTGDFVVDTDTLYVDTANDRVGIGTSTPGSTLDVVGDATISSNLAVGTANLFVDTVNSRVGIGTTTPGETLSIYKEDTTAAGQTKISSITGVFSGSDVITGGNINNTGLYINLDSSATGGTATNSEEHRVWGIDVDIDVTGDSDDIRGGRFFATSELDANGTDQTTNIYGIDAQGRHKGSAPNTNIIGVNARSLKSPESTGLTDTMIGLSAEYEVNAGTCTDAYGVRCTADRNGGAVTNSYLFYGAHAGNATTITNNYGLYVTGTDKHYLEGNVGIGYSAPDSKLDLRNSVIYNGETSTNFNPGTMGLLQFWAANTTATRWNITVHENNDLYFLCRTSGSGAGSWHQIGYLKDNTNVAQITFTGQHRSFIDGVSYVNYDSLEGLIVSANKNKYYDVDENITTGLNAIRISQSLPLVSLSCRERDKACFGVISGSEDPDSREYVQGSYVSVIRKQKGDTRAFINSVGEGAIWVTNINGSLESGDYITTSNVAGYGQKQDSDSLKNYTVAKITMDCDFDPVTQPVQIIKKDETGENVLDEHGQLQWEDHPTETEKAYKIRYLDADGNITDEANAVHKAAFVGCTYHCG